MRKTVPCKQLEDLDRCIVTLRNRSDAILVNVYRPVRCPHCKSRNFIKFGFGPTGIKRYCCKDCGKTFSAVTNSLLDSRKISVSEWVKYAFRIIRAIKMGRYNPYAEPRELQEYWNIFATALKAYDAAIRFSQTCFLDTFDYLIPAEAGDSLSSSPERCMKINILFGILAGTEDIGICCSLDPVEESIRCHVTMGTTLALNQQFVPGEVIQSLHLQEKRWSKEQLESVYGTESPLYDLVDLHKEWTGFLDKNSLMLRYDPRLALNLL